MDFEESTMERNSTACAMEWSIELEKALRSKNPGRCVEAILQIGPRLEQWAGEPEATMVVYNMFGLVPGEERLFVNTIYLRLAEAFLLGNKDVSISIVRVFLSLRRHCREKKKSKRIKGIFSKHNQLELIKRVKIVFDTGDPESRALVLVLFGCWADFAKDSAQIRHLVLSSLVSSNVLEVDFLLLLLNREKAMRIQANALRCMQLTFVKGMGQLLISVTVIKALLSIVEGAELPSTMQCEALQLLHKILLCRPPNLFCSDMPEFAELLIIVDNASQSPIISKSVVAIHVLVDIVIKFQRRREMGSDGVCTLPLPSQVVSLTMDRITLLVKPLLDLCQFNSIKVFEEVQSLLNLILLLVGEYPDLGVLVLDKVHLFIEHLVDSCNIWLVGKIQQVMT